MPLCDFNLSDLDVGTDLTDYLGIKKYEKIIDARLGGDNEGAFPNYIHRTDEIRLQTVPEVLDEMFDQMTYITVKLDGTSATYFCDRETGEFKVCSRNWAKKDGDNVYWNIAKKYHLADILKDTSFAIQGEIVGPGIQKNPLGLKEIEFFIFNIFNYETMKYLTLGEMVEWLFVYANDNLKLVPLLDSDLPICLDCSVDYFVEMAKGEYEGTTNQRGGIVVRSMTNEHSNVLGNRFSVKVINPDYKD